jgi:hypothetical protein
VGGRPVDPGRARPHRPGLGEGAARALARAFARIQWPAYGLLLITGLWNVSATDGGQPQAWKVVLGVKIAVVLGAGPAAWLHSRAGTKAGIAAWGAVTAVASVSAVALGVFLAG